MPAMTLRSAPFYNHLNFNPLYDGAGEGGGDPPKKPPDEKKPELPPSKHDAPLPEKQETFDRPYVEELRSENRTWRGKLTTERQAREAAEQATATANAAAESAKKAAADEIAAAKLVAETAANDRVIRAELKVAAQAAGMIDLDGLKLADISKVTLEADGTVKGADDLMTALKAAKPYLFGTPQKGNSNTQVPPKPGDEPPKKAKDMTPEERTKFLADNKKKFG